MARSVSIPYGALAVSYADASELDQYDFDDAVSNLRWSLQKRYPSLRPCNEWIGREDRAVLENPYCHITVSEYCGLVAVCAVPKYGNKASRDWCDKVKLDDAAGYFGPLLVSQGRFSNGEQVFRRAGEHISSNGSRW